MLVANSFDLWRKDAFFSAAEEVQESADIMESTYRAWLREKRERSTPEEFYELSRELQTTLGTAKWQLEEFEKAVQLSYRHGDDTTTTRHRQFIYAIESQISQVETALRESYSEEGKQPLRWVNLDEEERDDLAAFLSGTSQTIQNNKDECLQGTSSSKSSFLERQGNIEDKNLNANAAAFKWDIIDSEKASKDVIAVKRDADYAIEIKTDAVSRDSDDIVSQTDRTSSTRKTWSSPGYGALKIVIANEDVQRTKPAWTVDAAPKGRGFRSLFWKQKCEEPQAMRTGLRFNQLFGRIGLSHRQFQSPLQLRQGCSVQVKLALLLTIFLIGKLFNVQFPLCFIQVELNSCFKQPVQEGFTRPHES
ncbi:hypothetical protein AHAS_Ahas11G0346500 [Arachis hypogaea]